MSLLDQKRHLLAKMYGPCLVGKRSQLIDREGKRQISGSLAR